MLMSQPRQFHHHHVPAGGSGGGGQLNDTTFTKIFVGGLAWETQRDTMRNYFEQFGEILEAVVITDKSTGRSKGYGFVTFKDPEAALKACQNPSPIIDGRKANCNLASLGAQKNRPPPAHQAAIGGSGRFSAGMVAPPAFPASSSTYFHLQPSTQLAFPYSAYGYSGFSHDTMYPMNYYGVYGGQHFQPYYGAGGGTGGSGSAPYFHNIYPYYAPYASQGGQGGGHHHHQPGGGYGVQYHQHPAAQMLQYSYLPHQQHLSGTPGILSLPTTPLSMPNTATGSTSATGVVQSGAGSGQVPSQQASTSQHNSTSN